MSERGVSKKQFKQYVEEALEKIKEVDVSKLGAEEFDAFIDKYVQRRRLVGSRYSCFVVLDGYVVALSRVHFGNVSTGRFNLIKKVLIENKEIPLISENAFRGILGHYLRSLSRRMGIGEPTCGLYDESGQKFECGMCLKCGIMGFLNPGKGLNAPHRLNFRAFIPTAYSIVRETHNTIHPMRECVHAPREEGVSRSGEERAGRRAIFFTSEYIAPGARFPVQITMRDMACGEMGLALMAMNMAWHFIGVGRHKVGSFSTWEQRPEDWKLLYFRPPDVMEPEVYEGDALVDLVDKLKRCAYLAMEKRLFMNYEPLNLAGRSIDEQAEFW